jgi:hypothetical protein
MAHDPGTGTGTASVAPAESLVPAGFSDRLYNEDLAPAEKRDWACTAGSACGWRTSHSIGGYTFAAGLFFLGLNGWWVLAGLGVATFVVLGLMNLTGYAGQRLGVPYPVLARLSFGVLGANIPAIIRAIVGIAWYGIQTYLASFAVQILLLKMAPGLTAWTVGGFLGARRWAGPAGPAKSTQRRTVSIPRRISSSCSTHTTRRRRQLRLGRLRPVERGSEVPRLPPCRAGGCADGTAGHALEAVRQSGRHQLLPRRAGRVPRAAVRHPHGRLLLIRRERVSIAELYKLDGGLQLPVGLQPPRRRRLRGDRDPHCRDRLLSALAPFAWPIGVVLGAIVYYPLMRNQPVPGTVPPAPDEQTA